MLGLWRRWPSYVQYVWRERSAFLTAISQSVRRKIWPRLRRWARRFGALAAVLGAITVVTGSGIYVFRAVRDQWFWRGEEYDKLRSLRAGYALPYFEDVLGRPIFTRLRLSRRTGFRESTFKGHGYWVQTLSMAGVVKLYAVTSCDKSFHPTFSTGED